MNYKRSESKNIITNIKKNLKSDTKKWEGENYDYNIEINENTFISKYYGSKRSKNITLYNIEIDNKDIEILKNNISNDIDIVSIDTRFNVVAKIISYTIHDDEKNLVDFNVQIQEGDIFPNSEYRIILPTKYFDIKPSIIKKNKYYEEWGYSVYTFENNEDNEDRQIYISFKNGLINKTIEHKDKINISNFSSNNHQNGCVYLLEYDNEKYLSYNIIKDMIINNEIIQKFPINRFNTWNKHELYFKPIKNNYLLVQTHNCNELGECQETMIKDIEIYNFEKNNILYTYESKENLLDKTKIQVKNLFIFFIGIIFAKYYYNYRNNKNLKDLEKKYNKLESAYKFILKDKYNL
jgi:hypothetical protein